MRPINEIISEIKSFESQVDNWLRLDELVTELWDTGLPEKGMDALFKIFEKYPVEDGAGVFWSIVHGLETLDYEQNLYNSLINEPSRMTITMLKRIENSGSDTIFGNSILDVKQRIKINPKTASELLIEI